MPDTDTLEPIRYSVSIEDGTVLVAEPGTIRVESIIKEEDIEASKIMKIRGNIHIEDNKVIYESEARKAKPFRPYNFLPVVFVLDSQHNQCLRRGDTVRVVLPMREVLSRQHIVVAVNAHPVEQPSGAHLNISSLSINPFDVLRMLLPSFLERIVLLRHPDMGAIAEPVNFSGSARLDERARNLAEILLVLQARRGGFPERLERALREHFP